MAYDLVIRGGTVIDGSGADRKRADIAVMGGQIAEIGAVRDGGVRELDASGLMVTPGFIDGHTHFDAQIFWDGLGQSASLHGVTTCVMGNCGFTLAPSPAEKKDLAIRSIERAEDISREDMMVGVPWTWNTYADYLQTIDGLPKGINFAGYIGHSALRDFVMGERAFTDPATDEDIEAMQAEIRDALRAGAIGFSTSQIAQHRTVDDGPVASKVGSWNEVFALARVLGELGAGNFQASADIGDPEMQQQLVRIALATRRPVHFPWVYAEQRPDGWRMGASFFEEVEAGGGSGVGQVHVRELQNVIGFRVGLPYDRLPRWSDFRKRPLDEQLAVLREPGARQELVEEALHGPYVVSNVAAEVQARLPDYERLLALLSPTGPRPSVAELARQQGKTPVDVLIDLSLEADFNQFFTQPFANQDETVVEVLLRHPRSIIAQSDSGAHVSQIMDSSIPTYFLAHWVRERQAFTWEEAVAMLTSRPAAGLGIPGRGLLQEGYAADVVILDADRVGPRLPHAVTDLPAGGTRLVQEAEGIHATVVNGEILLQDGTFTDARPGQLVRGPLAAGR
ncbi:MAG: amidohydrolase family protein [Acidimicrobiaceae bacterium]|nr:amidohydrolase family protein [Acidimicrobiaceae bacterium]